MNIEKLWEYACSGNIGELQKYYNGKHTMYNYYEKFGEKHSLIMGAFRNNQFDTVMYLLEVGERLTPKEQEEINIELKRLKVLEILGNI